jgi:TRAP-type C4-dicarboxylate transport system permease small subunit
MPWSEELARYLMIWMGMLGAAVALRNGRHIGVTFFIEKLPERLHHGALALSQVTMIIFLVVVVKEGWLFALSNHSQRSPAMGISMLYPYLAVSVGAGLMILELLADLLHKIFPTQAGSHREMTTRVL